MKVFASAAAHRLTRYAASAAVALALSAAPAAATTIERVTSPGGIEAWLVHEPAVPLVVVSFAFDGGAAQDPDDKAGTANLMASLLDEGAGPYDSKAFQERLDRKAVHLSFRTGRETVQGSLRTLSENKDEAFDDLRLALTAPRFDTQDVELNRAQILSALRRQLKSPNDLASLRWWQTAYPGHPYGRPTGGTLESVPGISVDDLKTLAHKMLARDHLKVAVVGDIDAEAVKTMLDRVFGELPAHAELKPVPPAIAQGLGRRISVDLDVPQTVIDFGGPGIARNDPDFFAAYVVNHILGGGSFSSRLYQEVREKRGLVYSVSDTLLWFNRSAVFFGSTATRADRADETINLISNEIHQLAEAGPTPEELAKAKAYLNSSFVLNLDTSDKVAALLVQLQLDHQPLNYMDYRKQMIGAVTLADAKRVAKRLLDGGLLFTEVGRPSALANAGTPSGGAGGHHPALMPPGGMIGGAGDVR